MFLTLAQKLWQWSGGIDFGHFVAGLIFFWWARRQPRASFVYWMACSSRPRGTVAETQHRARADSSRTQHSRAKKRLSIAEDMSELLSDKEWQITASQSTLQERKRFLVVSQGNLRSAVNRTSTYLKWREIHSQLEQQIQSELELTGDQDVDDWMVALAVASTARKEKLSTAELQRIVGRVAKMHANHIKLEDRGGHRIIHVSPGRMDERIVGLRTFALAIALYIDRKLEPDSTEQMTLVVDVRGGVGWRNLNGAQLLPFIQYTISLLLSMFPERLARSVVYPVPPNFEWVWKITQRFIDPATAERINVLLGPATKTSPPPAAEMALYMDEEIIQELEKERKAAFVYD